MERQVQSGKVQSSKGRTMERNSQKQTVNIARGLFLVRYATAEDLVQPPTIKLFPEPAPNKDIGFLLHPDQNEAVLWQPDSCLVVRALAPGKLSVEVTPTREGASAAATVRIESLSQGTPASAAMLTNGFRTASSFNLSGLRILGHVAGTGDQFVNINEWIAGPVAPSRIEGISVDWADKPDGVEIHYAVKTAEPQPTSGRPMSVGSFAGTRGRTLPIVGLLLEISGPAAANLQFVVDAIFLGAPIKRTTGKRVVASGPTGREPLVGLRINIEETSVAGKPTAKSVTNERETVGHTRVFRRRSEIKRAALASVPLGGG
jgi:hypothetical protein